MSDRTLREKIEALRPSFLCCHIRWRKYQNQAIDEVLAVIDAHEAEQRAAFQSIPKPSASVDAVQRRVK